MNNKPQYVSRQGLEELREELEELTNVRRAEVAARIQEAKEHGDITENAEYEDAKNEQAFVEGRIQALSALIKNAVIIDENTLHDPRADRLDRGAPGLDGQGDATPSWGRRRPRPRRAGSRTNRRSVVRCSGKKKGDKVTVIGAGRGPGVQDPSASADLARSGPGGPANDVLGRRAGGHRR